MMAAFLSMRMQVILDSLFNPYMSERGRGSSGTAFEMFIYLFPSLTVCLFVIFFLLSFDSFPLS